MKKIFIVIMIFAVICLSIWFQINFLNSIPMSGVIPNFGIVLVAGLGLISGNFIGGVIGGVYGLLIDIALGRGIGIYMALYILSGCIAGFLNKGFSKGNKISMVMIILICTLIFEIFAYFLNVIVNGIELDFKILIITLTLESAYNMLLAILFFKPIAFLGDILNKSKNSYYIV